MVINLGAYSTEIIRAGIEATPKGQIEAGAQPRHDRNGRCCAASCCRRRAQARLAGAVSRRSSS
jgi:hypothetical protein